MATPNLKDLKEEVKSYVLDTKQKEKEAKQLVFMGLKKINFYCNEENPLCKRYIEVFEENKIKFEQKPMDAEYASIVNTYNQPVINVNGVNLVVSRDFTTPEQLTSTLLHVANPNFILPPFETRMEESIKNQFHGLRKMIQNLSRSIHPMARMLAGLEKEVREEDQKSPQPTKKANLLNKKSAAKNATKKNK